MVICLQSTLNPQAPESLDRHLEIMNSFVYFGLWPSNGDLGRLRVASHRLSYCFCQRIRVFITIPTTKIRIIPVVDLTLCPPAIAIAASSTLLYWFVFCFNIPTTTMCTVVDVTMMILMIAMMVMLSLSWLLLSWYDTSIQHDDGDDDDSEDGD